MFCDVRIIFVLVLTRISIPPNQVVVGAPLYELETSLDAAAAIAKPSEHAAAAPATSASAPAHTEEKSHGRIPLIKFIGKRSLVKHNEVATPAVVVAAPAVVVAAPKIVAPAQLIQEFKPVPPARIIKEGNGVDFSTLKRGAMFGRPALSQREMDSIENGGATY